MCPVIAAISCTCSSWQELDQSGSLYLVISEGGVSHVLVDRRFYNALTLYTVTNLQELVTHFDAMVTAVNTLADQALADFNGQMAAAADRTAAMQDAVTAMREAAALAEAMQQKYLEQTLMINAATGQTSEGEVCNRTRYLNVNFVVSRLVYGRLLQQFPGVADQRWITTGSASCLAVVDVRSISRPGVRNTPESTARSDLVIKKHSSRRTTTATTACVCICRSNGTSESATASRKRQLLASTGTVDSALFDQSSAEPLTQDTASWEGYQVSLRADAANRAVDETDIPELSRYLGASPGHNKVIGGLFLHTTRRTEQQNSMGCSGGPSAVLCQFSCLTSAAFKSQ